MSCIFSFFFERTNKVYKKKQSEKMFRKNALSLFASHSGRQGTSLFRRRPHTRSISVVQERLKLMKESKRRKQQVIKDEKTQRNEKESYMRRVRCYIYIELSGNFLTFMAVHK